MTRFVTRRYLRLVLCVCIDCHEWSPFGNLHQTNRSSHFLATRYRQLRSLRIRWDNGKYIVVSKGRLGRPHTP